jgi:hypothetical protein
MGEGAMGQASVLAGCHTDRALANRSVHCFIIFKEFHASLYATAP